MPNGNESIRNWTRYALTGGQLLQSSCVGGGHWLLRPLRPSQVLEPVTDGFHGGVADARLLVNRF